MRMQDAFALAEVEARIRRVCHVQDREPRRTEVVREQRDSQGPGIQPPGGTAHRLLIASPRGGGDHRDQIREARSIWMNASSCSSVELSTETSNIKEVAALRMDSASRRTRGRWPFG